MKKLIKIFYTTFLAFVFSTVLFSASAIADIAVIANSGSSASSMTSKDIKKIFLGKNTSMTPIDQAEGSATRNAFYQQVAKKSEAQMKAYWSKMIFSGKATPPGTASDDAAVKAWVVSNKNGIGYIDSSAVDDTVKVLLTVK